MIEGVLMGLIISLVVATQTVFMFTLKIGENSHFDYYFSTGLVQPPTSWPLFLGSVLRGIGTCWDPYQVVWVQPLTS